MGHLDKFDQLAARYDSAENIRMSELSSEAIRQLLDTDYTKTAVDLGCGTGAVGLSLIDNFENMLFADGSKNMLKEVDRKLTDSKITNATTLHFDLEKDDQLPYTVDTMILSLVLHHIPDHPQLFKKLYNNLNNGGQLMIVEMVKDTHNENHHHGINTDLVINQLTEQGFQNIQLDVFFKAKKPNQTSRVIISARK